MRSFKSCTKRTVPHWLQIALLWFGTLILFACNVAPSATVSPPPNPTATRPALSVTTTPSAILGLDAPKSCIQLTDAPLNVDESKGVLVVLNYDFPRFNSYLLEPKSDQLLDIENLTEVSWEHSTTDVSAARVSPNTEFLQAYLRSQTRAIVRNADNIFREYDTQGQEDWNRQRWLDNENMVFQRWLDISEGNYSVVIYNPFTGDERDLQIELPNPYLVDDISGRFSWVKADIASSLRKVLYNTSDERLVLWDLNTQREITALPSPADLMQGTWSPDGEKFAVPSSTSDAFSTEWHTIDMDGKIKVLTHLHQDYPFVDVGTNPSWSPNGDRIAYWLTVSAAVNDDPKTLRQWLAITNSNTMETQILCLSPGAQGHGSGIVWDPDGTQLIAGIGLSRDEGSATLVDLNRLTQTPLDTHGFFVIGWLTP